MQNVSLKIDSMICFWIGMLHPFSTSSHIAFVLLCASSGEGNWSSFLLFPCLSGNDEE
ncbi:hypothetical protein MtrunA17_Chr7g0257171 [Medicago truncatula]|uniref:Transmembrane protein n=1 Tax=Medicago truncatula TaxID=3880 RepID=A0A396H4Z3_MEDTR|nr:hypothetical protein MtrunA17_Chr7g0257171 [Medicago truncatula]